jgi:hypothetical protein
MACIATLAVVICQQHNTDVLDQHHQGDGPEHEAGSTEHVIRAAWLLLEDGRVDIQRGGADITWSGTRRINGVVSLRLAGYYTGRDS